MHDLSQTDIPGYSVPIEKSARRIPSDQLDYYIYVDYLTPEVIDLLIKIEIDSQHLSVLYVFKEAQMSRQEYFDKFGLDIPVSIYKLPANCEDWKGLSIGDKTKITFINVSENRFEGSDEGHIFRSFFNPLVNE